MSTSRRTKFGLFGLMVLALGLVVLANVWKSDLKVKRVTIEGNRIVETAEIMQLIKVPKNSQLQDVDLMSVRRDILSHHFIKDVIVERDLPATLRVTIQERVPLAILNAAEILYLDEDGIVLPHSVSKQIFDLPVLTGMQGEGPMAPGTKLKHPDIQEALKILASSKAVSKDLYYMISEVRLRNGGDIVLYTAERAVPVIFGRGEIASKLVRLESFWNEIVRERGAENLQYVDLRFEDQVVVRWNNKKS